MRSRSQPATPAEVEFEMLPMSYIFKAGHRLRLTLFFADPAAPTAPEATAKSPCFATPPTPSSVTLPIVGRPAFATEAAPARA